ncbi:MAG: ribonuclease HI [Spirochaetia bacterium]|nr:ribonuclease HI [Spirochaetia bacterium]
MKIQLRDDALNIFTDGSSQPKPRRGGYGIRFIVTDKNGAIEEKADVPSESFSGATNNQMELLPCLSALKAVEKRTVPTGAKSKIVIFSDSKYVVDHVKTAIYQWSKSKWRTKEGRPVANADIWKELLKVMVRLSKLGKRVEFVWVKGHDKQEHNEAVDGIARASANLKPRKHFSRAGVRKKWSKRKTIPGCVRMQGQAAIVRIITDEWLRVQKLYRCRYEVFSEQTGTFEEVDQACSNKEIKAAHFYRVRFNTDQGNPMLDESEEIDNPIKKEDAEG